MERCWVGCIARVCRRPSKRLPSWRPYHRKQNRPSRRRLAWETSNVAVRAEYAAIAGLRPEYLMTSRARMEELARVRRHAHSLPMATDRASEVRDRNRVH